MSFAVALVAIPGATPAYAARRRVIAFSRTSIKEGILKVRPNGSHQRRLSRGRDRVPEFSPDGSKIAFLRDLSDGDLLVVANANGKNEREIAYIDAWNNTCFWSRPFAWSPDGKRLVFQSNEDGDSDDWDSPDGRRIAYSRFGNRSDNYDIWIVNRNGRRHWRVRRTKRGDEVAPTWR